MVNRGPAGVRRGQFHPDADLRLYSAADSSPRLGRARGGSARGSTSPELALVDPARVCGRWDPGDERRGGCGARAPWDRRDEGGWRFVRGAATRLRVIRKDRPWSRF